MKHKEENLFAHFRSFSWLLVVVWTGCIAGSLLWNLRQQGHHNLEMARSSAQITFENDVLYRRWSAKQGGVYVRVSEDITPNPYLNVPDRDVTTTSGLSLTLVNPAYMARQVHQMAGPTGGSRGHITSLKPIRPENAPDAWEAAALRSFEQGLKEVSSVEKMVDGEYLRLMRPFVTEQGCLRCHAAQGYKEGDIRGGISVSVPMAPLRAIERPMTVNLALAHLGLWIVGLAGIGISKRSLGKEILARQQAEEEIRSSRELLRREGHQITLANRVLEAFVQEAGDVMYDKALDAVLEATGSKYGVFGYIDENGVLVCPTMSKLLAECEVPGKCIHYPREKWKGLWSRALLEKRILYTNTPSAVPGGHALITRNLAVPILFQGQAIGLWNLANKGTDYTEEDRQFIEAVANRVAPVLYAWLQREMRDNERKRAEEALRASREDLDRAQAVAQTGSWRLNVQRNELLWSDENWRLFGVPRGTPLTYETFLRTVHPDDRAYVHEKWSAGLRGEPYDIEHRIVVGDQIKWVRERAELEFDPQGTLLGGFGTTQDITAKKHAEEVLAAAKKAAEEANNAKSQFLANMSHELRTPMNAILGMVDLAWQKTADPATKDFLQTAKESADLLLVLLNDLLDSAKIESGKLELESAPFRLRRVLDQTAQVLAVRASEKGICFSCRIAPEVPDALIGDQVRLRQVLLNLAGNGIKFTERGEVTVSVRVFPRPLAGKGQGVRAAEESPHPDLLPKGEGEVMLEFAVRDTGIGIPRGELQRVFHPFAQADVSTTRRFGGTGLGLAICSSLVGMMGGRIWVESEPEKGSTFYFTIRLPLAKEVPPGPEPAGDVLASAPSTLRVLLVEDNPANQKLAAYILGERGHTVEIAGNGQQGLRMAEENAYDVILMDVQMPGMDGLDATKAIRARENGNRRVPIIAMTAHAMQGDRERCLAAGMDGYLSKPIDGHEMIALVETLAAGSPSVAAGTLPLSPAPAEPASPPVAAVFDAELALKRCLNSPDMLADMIQRFYDEVDNLFPQMHAALQKGDLLEVGRLGHRLKGTVVYLGADSAGTALLRVEQFEGHGGEQAEADEAVRALERECEVLKTTLAAYQTTTSPTQHDQRWRRFRPS